MNNAHELLGLIIVYGCANGLNNLIDSIDAHFMKRPSAEVRLAFLFFMNAVVVIMAIAALH